MREFVLLNPISLQGALALLADKREPARALAGGQDLLTELQAGLDAPQRLVNLKSIQGLDQIQAELGSRDSGGLAIGALATLANVARHDAVRSRWLGVAQAAASVASPQIRSCATVGGNLCQRPRCWYFRAEEAPCLKKGGGECYAKTRNNKYNAILGGGPSWIVHPSDLAPALIAHDAEVDLASRSGERTLPLERFFLLPKDGGILRENALEPGELVVRVRCPDPGGMWRSTYLKFRERESFDFALVSVAAGIDLENGRVTRARIVLGGVAPVPWRVPEAEALLVGELLAPAVARAAAEAALAGAEPLSENGYKVALAKTLVERALLSLA